MDERQPLSSFRFYILPHRAKTRAVEGEARRHPPETVEGQLF